MVALVALALSNVEEVKGKRLGLMVQVVREVSWNNCWHWVRLRFPIVPNRTEVRNISIWSVHEAHSTGPRDQRGQSPRELLGSVENYICQLEQVVLCPADKLLMVLVLHQITAAHDPSNRTISFDGSNTAAFRASHWWVVWQFIRGLIPGWENLTTLCSLMMEQRQMQVGFLIHRAEWPPVLFSPGSLNSRDKDRTQGRHSGGGSRTHPYWT